MYFKLITFFVSITYGSHVITNSCFEYETKYFYPNTKCDISQDTIYKPTPEECQKYCMDTWNCKYWDWYNNEFLNKQFCTLSTCKGMRLPGSGHVIGPKYCQYKLTEKAGLDINEVKNCFQ